MKSVLRFKGGVDTAVPGKDVTAMVMYTDNNITDIYFKGGPGSGNFDHAGRPGEVGGSAPTDAAAEPIINTEPIKITAHDDKYMETVIAAELSDSNTGTAYFIIPDGTVIAAKGLGHDGIGYNLVQQNLYDLARGKIDVMTDLESMGGMSAIKYLLNNTPSVRIDQLSGETNIETGAFSTAMLRRLQRYVDAGKLELDDRIVWDSYSPEENRTMHVRATRAEFMMAKYIVIENHYATLKEHDTSAIVAFDMANDPLLSKLHSDIDAPHITLLYLGNIATLDKARVLGAIRDYAASHAPITMKYTGIGNFKPSKDGMPVVALFDSPHIPAFRQAIVRLLDNLIVEQNHGFIPHMTLKYETSGPMEAYDVTLDYEKTFDKLSVYWGDEVIDFQLTGNIVEKQLPIDDESKANLITIRTEIFNNAVDVLAERVYTGDISIGTWEELMKAEIKSLHTSVAVIGKGAWEDMTPSDWGRVGQEIRQQYRYLHGFAETLSTQQDTISLRAIQARAHMYANASKHTAALLQAGEFAGGTRRQPGRFKGLPWMPGDGSTECLVNCKCHWALEVVSTSTKTKLVKATWTLTPAEHCEDCLDRKGYTEIIKVPIDTVVPSTIGGL